MSLIPEVSDDLLCPLCVWVRVPNERHTVCRCHAQERETEWQAIHLATPAGTRRARRKQCTDDRRRCLQVRKTKLSVYSCYMFWLLASVST